MEKTRVHMILSSEKKYGPNPAQSRTSPRIKAPRSRDRSR